MIRKSLSVFLLLIFSIPFSHLLAQTKEEIGLEKIFKEELTNGRAYEMLDQLSNGIGARLSGSPQAAAAVEWGKQMMETFGLDTVYLQEVMVPHWVRGDKEIGKIISPKIPEGSAAVNICALGGSIGTGKDGITGEIIEVRSFDELTKLGKKVRGKIIFFNRPMDPTEVNTFEAYGGAVNQRGRGAIEAGKLGAIGVIVRSMTLADNNLPHTGAMRYDEKVKKIPACAISTHDADILSDLLKKDKAARFFFRMTCETLAEVKSYNVVGEIRGSQNPEEIIVIGGHLDSWDLGKGAHDDGAGVVQSLEAIRLFKVLKFKPKRTIRVVLFMNEENGLRGGTKYAELAKQNNEKTIAAIETDRGGFSPRGFTVDTTLEVINRFNKWHDLLSSYGIGELDKGGAGADVYTLKYQGAITMDLLPDSQRYFDVHHCASDTLEMVNKRELELGAAAMASMMYLLAEFGVE